MFIILFHAWNISKLGIWIFLYDVTQFICEATSLLLKFSKNQKKLEGKKNVVIQNQIGSNILKNLKGSGADAIKKFTPSLGIPYLGV